MGRFREALGARLRRMSCIRWRCWFRWRMWFRPVVVLLYAVLLVTALPLLIWALYKENANDQFKGWFVAGLFMLLTIPIFLFGLVKHLVNYTQPHVQKYIIRILWLVPIFSIESWLSLAYRPAEIYLSTIRDCYEAYVLYSFLRYLINYLEYEYDLVAILDSRPRVKQPCIWCRCLPRWPTGRRFIRRCQLFTLQNTLVRILVTITALISALFGKYGQSGSGFSFNSADIYLAVVTTVSQIMAIYGLVYFYRGTSDLLKPINPIGKFISIKALIFFSKWQGILIKVLVKTGSIPSSWEEYDLDSVATGLQNLIICMEMLVAAIAHYYIFSHKPYIDPAAARVPCITSCLRMLDVRDMAEDVKEHFVDPPRKKLAAVKRRLSRKSAQWKEMNENVPLLHGEEPYDEEEEQVPKAAKPLPETETIHVVVHSHAEPDLESGSDPQKVEAEVVKPESDSPQAKVAITLELESDSEKTEVAVVLESESDSQKAEVPITLELESDSPKAEVPELETDSPKAEVLELESDSEMAEFAAMADPQKDDPEVPT